MFGIHGSVIINDEDYESPPAGPSKSSVTSNGRYFISSFFVAVAHCCIHCTELRIFPQGICSLIM